MSADQNLNGKQFPGQKNQEAKWPDYDPRTTKMKQINVGGPQPKPDYAGKHVNERVTKPVYAMGFQPKHAKT